MHSSVLSAGALFLLATCCEGSDGRIRSMLTLECVGVWYRRATDPLLGTESSSFEWPEATHDCQPRNDTLFTTRLQYFWNVYWTMEHGHLTLPANPMAGSKKMCLDLPGNGERDAWVDVWHCEDPQLGMSDQRWHWDGPHLVNTVTGQCLSADHGSSLYTSDCGRKDDETSNQRWEWIDVCQPSTHATGRWLTQSLSTGSAQQRVSVTSGVERTKMIADAAVWEAAVADGIADNFSVATDEGVAEHTTYDVESGHATAARKSISGSLHEPEVTTVTVDFPAGVVWQWQGEVDDGCGGVHHIRTLALTSTANTAQGPCCAPGESVDPKDARGRCTDMRYCLCEPGHCAALRAEAIVIFA